MANHGLTPGATYTLKLGSTWDHIPTDLIHAVQYDFKPASVDPSQPGQMKLDSNNGVSVILPHRDTDECAEFKGNKQPTSKECFLIIDRENNTAYFEKVSNMIRVKKYRSVAKKTARNAVRRDEDRASPVPSALQSKDRESPVPSLQEAARTASQETARTSSQEAPRTTVQETLRTAAQPTVAKPDSAEPAKSEVSSAEPKAKRLKQSVLASSGNLSSETSGSDSDSSNESSDSDNDKFANVKSEDALTLAGSAALITPLGEPPLKQEPNSGVQLMDMLSQDLDLTDSDSD